MPGPMGGPGFGPGGFGGPHGPHGHFGPHGPHGPFGPHGPHGGGFRRGIYAPPGPIRPVPGYANGNPGRANNVSVFDSLSAEIKYSIKKNGALKGTIIGFYSFATDPFLEYRYALTKNLTQRAFEEGRITQEQYDYRMVRNEERIHFKKLRSHYITQEEYDELMDALEEKHPTMRR